MRVMPIRPSNRASLIATASFVFALGAAVGPIERQAFAQQNTSPSKTQEQDKKGKDKEEGDAASTAPASEEEQKKAEASKKAVDPKKPEHPENHEDHSKELDTSVESKKAIYFSGDLGFTRSDLGGISDKTGFDRTVANGVLYGLSTGVRLNDLRFGGRWRVYDTTEFQLWTLALSAGYGLPLRPVSPVFSAHVGYVFDQHVEEALFRKALPPGTLLPPDIDLKGLLVGLDVNASYWVTKFFRLGAFIGADFMFLSREKASLPQSIFGVPAEFAANPLYTDSGSSVGLNVNFGLRGAFDIGFK
jgi:hypothetical protein